jgi:hypothetical protein
MMNGRYATRNFALQMVVGRTPSIKRKKEHKLAVQSKASSNSISNYLSVVVNWKSSYR